MVMVMVIADYDHEYNDGHCIDNRDDGGYDYDHGDSGNDGDGDSDIDSEGGNEEGDARVVQQQYLGFSPNLWNREEANWLSLGVQDKA